MINSNQLAIKYRPQSLSEVIGHEKVVNELKKRVEKKQIPNVMLFSGKTGVGKDTLAYIMAKTIQCTNLQEDGSPCNECRNCKSIIDERWGSANTYLIDCANSGKSDIQALERLSTSSTIYGGNKQVIIVDEFQALVNDKTKQSLLKMIEKPNPNAVFILTTMDLSAVPKAIINRTVHYKLNELKMNDLSDLVFDLVERAEKEFGLTVPEVFFDPEKGGMGLLLNSAEGSARTLVSNLERVLFGELWTKEEVKEAFDFIDETTIFHCLNLAVKKDAKFFEEINAINSVEEFFYLSYETLVETISYHLSGSAKNDWKKTMYDQLISSGKKNLNGLVKLYNDIFENIGKYFKKAYFVGKFLEYYSDEFSSEVGKQVLQEVKKVRRVKS